MFQGFIDDKDYVFAVLIHAGAFDPGAKLTIIISTLLQIFSSFTLSNNIKIGENLLRKYTHNYLSRPKANLQRGPLD